MNLDIDNIQNIMQLSIPTDACLEAAHELSINKAMKNKTCVTYWMEPVIDSGVLTPKTEIIPFSTEAQMLMVDELPKKTLKEDTLRYQEEIDNIEKSLYEFGENNGYPFFLKNSLFSAKHEWDRSCFIKDKDTDIMSHLSTIVYSWLMNGESYSLYITPRKFIKSNAGFTAFEGMPIGSERRYFMKDGEVVARHPYWPPESIESSHEEPSDPKWRDILEKLNHETDDEILFLTKETEKINIEGFWSVDWMKSEDGDWYMIDMAEGDKSYMWKDFLEDTGQIPNLK